MDEYGVRRVKYRPNGTLVVTQQPRQEALLVWHGGATCHQVCLFRVEAAIDFEAGARADAGALLYNEALKIAV